MQDEQTTKKNKVLKKRKAEEVVTTVVPAVINLVDSDDDDQQIVIDLINSDDEELLVEPDETEGRPEREISSGGVAGATVPLGASSAQHPGVPKPKFPSSKVGKKNSKNG